MKTSFLKHKLYSISFWLKGLFLISLISLSSCSNYQKILKGNDYDLKMKTAIELYEKKEYGKAYPILEELISIFRATNKAEDIYYYYAFTNYHLDDLVSAAYHFQQFSKTYPNSKRAEETAFMAAYCFYKGSPVYSLDQTNTYKAINELQLYLNSYPNSTRVAECNELIDKLRAKLEKKDYETGLLFFNLMDYKAANVSLRNTLKNFPNTKYKEEIMLLILKSNYNLAENSVEEKKKERYKQTIDAYINFIDKFADQKKLKEAEAIYTSARSKYERL
ncbi:MAG: outer membrane protein assembly factor BamD [Flavobacteriales bacterium]